MPFVTPKIIVYIFFTLFFLHILTFSVFGKTSQEIETEIQQKKKEAVQLDESIARLEKEIQIGKQKLDQTATKREQFQTEISNLDNEKKLVQTELQNATTKKQLKELEVEERIKKQNEIITSAYLNWKETNWMKEFLGSESEDFMKIATYQESLNTQEQANIENIGEDITKLEAEIESNTLKEQQLQAQLIEMDKKKQSIEIELTSLDQKVKENSGDIGNYRAKLGETQQQINALTKEQQEIQEYERQLLKKAKNGGTKKIINGEIYFQGVGREVYQGHGVGLSQFGALGAALKGWDYKQILKLYYPDTKFVIVESNKTIKVDGYGEMSIEAYTAGAGEIPDFSCEDIGEKFDPDNIWKCWPQEAIKAQIVAFRTYGLEQTQNGASICTTARCQVYKGGENKQWAAEATQGQIIVYEGKPIKAFYSSDNHNGWGTADNDTVWSNFEGEGIPLAYLRAVNDSAVTYKFTYTDWSWRTNSYTMEEIEEMFRWSSESDKASQGYKTFIKSMITRIGNLQSLEFERDKSGRVKRIKLEGTKDTAYIAGWLFKSIWNIYAGNEMPSGEADYIYSLTYFIKKG